MSESVTIDVEEVANASVERQQVGPVFDLYSVVSNHEPQNTFTACFPIRIAQIDQRWERLLISGMRTNAQLLLSFTILNQNNRPVDRINTTIHQFGGRTDAGFSVFYI